MVSRRASVVKKLTISGSPEPGCRGRLWRSEIEVVPEVDESIIGQLISEKQQARVSCQCNAEAILKNQ